MHNNDACLAQNFGDELFGSGLCWPWGLGDGIIMGSMEKREITQENGGLCPGNLAFFVFFFFYNNLVFGKLTQDPTRGKINPFCRRCPSDLIAAKRTYYQDYQLVSSS